MSLTKMDCTFKPQPKWSLRHFVTAPGKATNEATFGFSLGDQDASLSL